MSPTESLTLAAFNGRVDEVRRLLDEGVNIDALGEDDYWNPLHAAIENERLDCVRLLVERGANIELRLHELTPLAHAIDISVDGTNQRGGKAGDEPTDIICYLLQAGADIQSGIEKAQQDGSDKIMRLLASRLAS